MTPGEPAAGPGAAVVLGELRALGRDDGIAAISRLSGVSIADAWLITYADGAAVLTAADRRAVERLCARLPDLIPAAASITQFRETLAPFYPR